VTLMCMLYYSGINRSAHI